MDNRYRFVTLSWSCQRKSICNAYQSRRKIH